MLDVSCSTTSEEYNFVVANEIIYKVLLHRSEEGIAVQCPALPGCWSQGKDEEDALDNIADAIREYLGAIDERTKDAESREVRVAV